MQDRIFRDRTIIVTGATHGFIVKSRCTFYARCNLIITSRHKPDLENLRDDKPPR